MQRRDFIGLEQTCLEKIVRQKKYSFDLPIAA